MSIQSVSFGPSWTPILAASNTPTDLADDDDHLINTAGYADLLMAEHRRDMTRLAGQFAGCVSGLLAAS